MRADALEQAATLYAEASRAATVAPERDHLPHAAVAAFLNPVAAEPHSTWQSLTRRCAVDAGMHRLPRPPPDRTERTPEYAGQIVFYGRTERAQALRTKSTVLHFDGRIDADGRPAGAFGHFWDEGLSVWFARVTRPPLPVENIGFHPVAEWAELIRTVAPGVSDVVDLLLAETETVHVSNARNVPFAAAAAPRLPVILCGDADHAITPAEGVGARDAIEDAAAIFRALSTGSSPADAMAARRRQIAADRQRVVPPYRRTEN
ncbi:hypothetical protein NG2371_05972 [Nocardia gamkensis]|nr:hypothetical protein [Nocardia gamkensis]